MITQETAAEIWHAYREIATAEKLLKDMEEEAKWEHDNTAPVLKDAFGRRRHLQLGIPSGDNSSRLLDVPRNLAVHVIRAHIAEKQKILAVCQENARIELLGAPPAPASQGLIIPPHLQHQVQRWISAAKKLPPPETATTHTVHTSDGIPFRAITYGKPSPGSPTIKVASWELLSPKEEPLGIFFFENPVPES